MSDTKERIIRITVVGDGYTGKTCLLIVYKDGSYNEVYIPTVFDSYSMNLPIDNQDYKIILQDTAGQEDYDKLRAFAYKETDVFILCYAIDNRSSYKNVEHWNKEIKHHVPKAKVILVGTKADLRPDSPTRNCCTSEEGEKMKSSINASAFFETSSKKLYNVKEAFDSAILAGVNKSISKYSRKNKKNNFCQIL